MLLAGDDAKLLKIGNVLRLKDLYNVELVSLSPLKAKYVGDSIEQLRKAKGKIVHWAPVSGISVKVLGPEGSVEGIGEAGIKNELNKVVQFERFGFCRIDAVDENEVVAYFAHK